MIALHIAIEATATVKILRKIKKICVVNSVTSELIHVMKRPVAVIVVKTPQEIVVMAIKLVIDKKVVVMMIVNEIMLNTHGIQLKTKIKNVNAVMIIVSIRDSGQMLHGKKGNVLYFLLYIFYSTYCT